MTNRRFEKCVLMPYGISALVDDPKRKKFTHYCNMSGTVSRIDYILTKCGTRYKGQ